MSLVAVAFFSCEPTYTKTYSWAYPVAGDWMVKAYVNGAEVGGPYEIKSYNSAFGKDSIWIDDYATTSSNGNFWSFKVKTAVNMGTKTFSTVGSKNAITNYGINIVVSNGKIIGNDSITMDVVFADDATTTYKLAGHREVSYEEYTQQ
ncbi:MAG: lipid-binding protein [Paludibacter sp.]|nr:lipid-binding protein [Paludibacter sp.]